ncbi:MAG: hypothetical protein AMXMBFR7_30860 [Planctomycetota bacterium]
MAGMVKQDLISILGGGLALSALIFGAGLFLLGSSSTPHADAHGHEAEAKSGEATEHAKSSDASSHAEEEHAEAHGEAHADAHGEPGKSEHTAEPAHGKAAESPHAAPDVAPTGGVLDAIEAGESALARGRPDQALTHLQRAMKMTHPEPPSPRLLLSFARATLASDLLPTQKRNEAALAQYARLLAEHPHAPQRHEAQYGMARCYLALGKMNEAMEVLGEYERQFPDGPQALDAKLTRAEILLAKNTPMEALKLLTALRPEKLTQVQHGQIELLRANAHLKLAHSGRTPEPAPEEYEETPRGEPMTLTPPPVVGVTPKKEEAPKAESQSPHGGGH